MSATLAGMRSQILEQMELLQNDVTALRCISGLFAGQTEGANAIELSEMTYILDPIIERQKAVIDEIRGLFDPVGPGDKKTANGDLS